MEGSERRRFFASLRMTGVVEKLVAVEGFEPPARGL